MVDQNMSANDLKITFYSTSPPEYSKSKYPKQNKTSYRMPSSSMTGANITVPAHVQEEEPLASHRSLPREKRKTESKKNEIQKHNKEKKQNKSTDQPTRSHHIRIRTAPSRYEPVENVTDDYRPEEHDSESDYSSD